MSKQIFFCTGFPRSRTAWLATLLTWGDCFCFHDGLADIESLDELDEKFNSVPGNIVGNSDPANLLFHAELMKRYPEAKWVVIHRNIEECQRSFRKASGWYIIPEDLEHLMTSLMSTNPCIVNFYGLNHLDILIHLVKFINVSMPIQRIKELQRLNIQILPELCKNIRPETIDKMNRLKASINECVLA